MEMENRVSKDFEEKIKKTKKRLTGIIEEVEDSIPIIAEEVAQVEFWRLKKGGGGAAGDP